MGHINPRNSKQMSFSFSSQTPRASLFFLITFSTILILLQLQAFSFSFSSSSPSWQPFSLTLRARKQKSSSRTFLPLKDLRFADTAMEGHTWFMSSLNDTHEPGEAEHLHFPSAADRRLLCLSGHSHSNGTANSYALELPDALPPGAALLRGLTFVSDTYYDYDNLCHGLSAVMPFMAWHLRKQCVLPARWMLYHRGELRTSMSPWVRALAEAVFARVDTEELGGGAAAVQCMEEAVVFRHNEGAMSRERKREVYQMMRCKARAYCGGGGVGREAAAAEGGGKAVVRMTLLLRSGARAFRDDAAVMGVFEKECRKVEGCRLAVARPNNLTFCDQVKLMTNTDILVSSHGAQMTNMFFMDKNSSVMEFFPKGWLELAGVGQYVYRWIADGSGMRHQGAWNDPQGDRCPESNESKCFPFYKDRKIGLDAAFFANWTSRVLREMKEYKLSSPEQPKSRSCTCDK